MDISYSLILIALSVILMMVFISSENVLVIKLTFLSIVLLLGILSFDKMPQLSIVAISMSLVIGIKHYRQKITQKGKIALTLIGIPLSFMFMVLFINNSVANGLSESDLVEISISSLCYIALAITILINITQKKSGSNE